MSPRHNPFFLSAGFTLIEVVTAVAILSVGIVMILRYFLSSSAYLNRLEYEAGAISLLSSKMDSLALSAVQNGTLPGSGGQETVILNNRKARMEWSYSPVVDSGDSILRPFEVSVRAVWTAGGRENELKLNRYVLIREDND